MIELEETSHYLPHEGVANVADATLERRRCSGRDVDIKDQVVMSWSQLSIWRLLAVPQSSHYVHISLGRTEVSCFSLVAVTSSGARYSVCLGPVYVGPA